MRITNRAPILASMRNLLKAIAITMFGLTGLLVIIGLSFDSEETAAVDDPATVVDDPTAGVRQACREFIGRSLNDPSSVKWQDFPDWSVNVRTDGIITVRAEYIAKNGFGANVREVTFCDITKTDDTFRLAQFRQ